MDRARRRHGRSPDRRCERQDSGASRKPAYDLRRLWIPQEEFSLYYGGFANEGLWPLCHLVDVRPKFRREDWTAYKKVNAQFAAAIDREMLASDTPVFLQDYHLAMAALYLRRRRPHVRTALFWHIPWPNPDRLLMCQWRRELLAGLLANDLLAFQVERDRRNFLLAVEDELGAEVEADGASVRFKGRSTTVVSVPIGVDYDRIQGVVSDEFLDAQQAELRHMFGLAGDNIVGVGVDRLDYTKGIPERLEAIDRVLTAARSARALHLRAGRRALAFRARKLRRDRVGDRSESGGSECQTRRSGRRAAHLLSQESARPSELVALYRMAHFCVVSSLADGMNLVAKEFVASRDDEDGVLVLSALAGAAEELREALIINPYDVDGFANALTRAIDMDPEERRLRMRAMRRIVAGRNVFSWASDILEGLESLWTKPLRVRGTRSGRGARLRTQQRSLQRLSGVSFCCSSSSASRRTASRHLPLTNRALRVLSRRALTDSR